MINPIPVRAAGLLMALALATGLGACGGDEDPAAAPGTESPTTSEPTSSDPSPTETGAAPPDDGRPFGSGCKKLFSARDDGSIAEAADSPVAILFMSHPREMGDFWGRLGRFVDLGSDGMLEHKDVTIFVPWNAGFDALSTRAQDGFVLDPAYQKAVIRRHIVAGRLAPSDLAGDHTTIGGETLSIEVDGEDVRLSSAEAYKDASVVCGNVQTLDATVYVIDTPLLHVWMGAS
jgi:hypothetical protein